MQLNSWWELLAASLFKRRDHFDSSPRCLPIYLVFFAVLGVELCNVASCDVVDEVGNEPILRLRLVKLGVDLWQIKISSSCPNSFSMGYLTPLSCPWDHKHQHKLNYLSVMTIESIYGVGIYPCRTQEWWTRGYASDRCLHSFLLFSRNYTAPLTRHTWIAFLSRTHGLSLRQPTSSSTILVQLAWTYPCEAGTQLLPNPDEEILTCPNHYGESWTAWQLPLLRWSSSSLLNSGYQRCLPRSGITYEFPLPQSFVHPTIWECKLEIHGSR